MSEADEFLNFSAFEQKVDVPAPIKSSSAVLGISLHPLKNVIASGTVEGTVRIYSYSMDKSRSNHMLMTFKHHKKRCKSLEFSSSGDYLFSGSHDTTIRAIDMDTGSVARTLVVQDGSWICSLLPIDDYLLASGDHTGRFILWDFRRQFPIMSLKSSNKCLTSLTISSDRRTIVATSKEGTVTDFNLRSRCMEHQSNAFNSEFLTSTVIQKGSRVVVGDSRGALNSFNWGEWNNTCDIFSGHPGRINAILPVSDNIICTACSDCNIRAVQLSPNKFLGIIGDQPFLQALSISSNKKMLASCSTNRKIKFYDLSPLEDIKKMIPG